jgi:hypothetical protein
VPGIVKRLQHATLRQRDRIIEGARPSHQVVGNAMAITARITSTWRSVIISGIPATILTR